MGCSRLRQDVAFSPEKTQYVTGEVDGCNVRGFYQRT